jgi:tetratricopeptide (TPR) repeat protein
MTSARMKVLAFVLLAAPCPAYADNPPVNPKSAEAPRAEDIEVMRRILNRALNLPRYGSHVVQNPYANQDFLTGQPVYQWDSWNNTPQNQPHIRYPGVNPSPYIGINTWPNNSLTTVTTVQFPAAEGVYLKNQGVVFTLVLPPQAHLKASQAAPANKPLSEWDRVRKEVRGEKMDAAEAKPAQEPTVADLILKVLADNGRHLAQLGPDETVTVVVTFRDAEPAKGMDPVWGQYNINFHNPYHPIDLTHLADINSKHDMLLRPAELVNPWTIPGQSYLRPGDSEPKKEQPREISAGAKDNILLGDLQQKQGKLKEAVEAYKNALKNLDPDKDLETYRQVSVKLAQVLLAQGDAEEAKTLLDKALEKKAPKEVAKPPEQPQPTASPLPAKLIISAPKKLLDQVGEGKITLEEFKKQATVDYQKFAPEKSASGSDKK